MASPVWQTVASTTNSTAGTTCQITKPSGVVQGDLMIAAITISGVATISAPGGWTAIRNAVSTDVSHATFWKIAGASEPANYSFTWTGSVRNVGSIHRITGTHATTPVEGSAVSATGASNTPDPPSYTPGSSQDYLFVVTFGQAAKGNTATPPTNYTERSDVSTSGAGPNSAHAASSLATRALTTGAAQDPDAFASATNGNWVANTIAIQPPAGAATFNGTGAASLAFSASGTGNYQPAVFNGTGSASIVASASATGEFLEYAIFRRTPQTGAVFDPDVATPIVEVVTSPYVDLNLAAGGYDYQVFRRTASGWSSGSNVEQVSVSAGDFNGQGSASVAFSASGTGFVEYDGQGSASLVLSATADGHGVYDGTGSASLAFTATGAGNHAPPGFNGQGSAALAFTASGNGHAEHDGQGSAALVFTASASGFGVYEGTASASLALTATATGQFVPAGFNGAGSASLAFSATGTGDYEPAVFNATAAASLVFSATGQGDAGVPTWNGQGSANLVFTATGTGDHEPPEFNATGSAGLVFTSTGTGQFVPAGFSGQASANLAFTATGTGAFDATWDGTGSASMAFTATGQGANVYEGTGQADLVFSATAFGKEGVLQFIRIESAAAAGSLVDTGGSATSIESAGLVGSSIEGA